MPISEKFLRNLDLNLLKTFHQIVLAGGISRAAAGLSRKQPAISLALKRLEDRLGSQLCTRGAAGFQLTSEGVVLAEVCEQLMATVNNIQRIVPGVSGEVRGSLAIKLLSHIKSNEFEETLFRFHRLYPRVLITLDVVDSHEAVKSLLRHEADLAISSAPTKRPELIYRRLMQEVHRVYCGRTHPLFGRSVKPFNSLNRYPFVITDNQDDDSISRFRAKMGFGQLVCGVSSNLEEARRLVMQGIGIGLFPEEFCRRDVENGMLWPIGPKTNPPTLDIFVITEPGLVANRVRELFLRVLNDVVAGEKFGDGKDP